MLPSGWHFLLITITGLKHLPHPSGTPFTSLGKPSISIKITLLYPSATDMPEGCPSNVRGVPEGSGKCWPKASMGDQAEVWRALSYICTSQSALMARLAPLADKLPDSLAQFTHTIMLAQNYTRR